MKENENDFGGYLGQSASILEGEICAGFTAPSFANVDRLGPNFQKPSVIDLMLT